MFGTYKKLAKGKFLEPLKDKIIVLTVETLTTSPIHNFKLTGPLLSCLVPSNQAKEGKI